MKRKIKFIQEKGEWSNSSGTFNKYQVQFDDGKSSSSKGVKRGRTLDDILEDKGFLEF